MTSKLPLTDCYVYITLPGETEATLCGRFQLTDSSGVPLGRFVYGRSYLAHPGCVPIDPVELTLSSRVYQTTALNGIFGALRDAGPDYWGRRVIERHAGKPQLGELDYLLESPDDRAGALGFGLGQAPPAPKRHFNKTVDLTKLQQVADILVKDEDPPVSAEAGQIEELLLLGTSMGGARPKAVVEDADGLWLAKFNRVDDRWNNARVEHAMLALARSCGITTAESKIVEVGGRDVLLVKRFDREKVEKGYLRARMVSGLALLRAEDSHRSREKWSYVLLAEELRKVCRDAEKSAAELFRRMSFNALISNTDDHPRNHAILAWEQDWKLSPAYDLTPTSPISLERRDLALAGGDLGRYANARNFMTQAPRFLLSAETARSIIDDMEERVRTTWHAIARRSGVTERDCGLIKGAFAYPGLLTGSRPLRPAL
jgi:serine/threonine-protein kinase HipA